MPKEKDQKKKKKTSISSEPKKASVRLKKSKAEAQESSLVPRSPTDKVPKSGREASTMEELLAETGYELRGVRRGDLLDGVVAAVSPREVLVDVGLKTEAVVADKEMETMASWLATLTPGEKVTAYVVLPENDNGQTVVSLRRAGMDKKWKEMKEKEKTGEEIEAKGIEINRGGLIVETEGIRGFIPSSQLEQSYSSDPSSLINKVIRVHVIEADQSQSKLIFSQRKEEGEALAGRVTALKEKIKIGDNVLGDVTGVATFGIFVKVPVDLENKLSADGLVHISEIAWEKVEDVNKYFKIGQKVKALVLGIDDNTGKLNLSVKQLVSDPWKEVANKFAKDQIVTGKVTRIVAFGVFVNLAPGVDGLIHVSKIPAGMEFKVDQEVSCMIESVDPASRKISLSVVPTEKPVGYR